MPKRTVFISMHGICTDSFSSLLYQQLWVRFQRPWFRNTGKFWQSKVYVELKVWEHGTCNGFAFSGFVAFVISTVISTVEQAKHHKTRLRVSVGNRKAALYCIQYTLYTNN